MAGKDPAGRTYIKFEKRLATSKRSIVLVPVVSLLLALACSGLPSFLPQALYGRPLALLPLDHTQVVSGSGHYPNGAVRFMQQNGLAGNVLAEFTWGEYLMFLFHPRCRVAMDGRYETVYPHEVSRAYFDFLWGEDGWRDFLAAHPHDLILLDPASRAHALLAAEPGWRLAYKDAGCALYVRDGLPAP